MSNTPGMRRVDHALRCSQSIVAFDIKYRAFRLTEELERGQSHGFRAAGGVQGRLGMRGEHIEQMPTQGIQIFIAGNFAYLDS